MRLLIIAALAALWAVPAAAHPDDRYFDGRVNQTAYKRLVVHVAAYKKKRKGRPAHWRSNQATVIGGRPPGCPARFCGCGASIEVFGRIIPALNLAANWLRFPKTSPAPGMVAARRGHVFVLRQQISGSTWLVHDSNSGGRMTRLHPRSIAGYAIVNPRG